MLNKVQEGCSVTFLTSAIVTSGDPLLFGTLPCVANIGAASGTTVTAETEGVFLLSVKGIDAGGNLVINNGDKIYFTAGDTPKLSVKASGTFFGYAYDDTKAVGTSVVTSGATATIAVLLPK